MLAWRTSDCALSSLVSGAPYMGNMDAYLKAGAGATHCQSLAPGHGVSLYAEDRSVWDALKSLR